MRTTQKLRTNPFLAIRVIAVRVIAIPVFFSLVCVSHFAQSEEILITNAEIHTMEQDEPVKGSLLIREGKIVRIDTGKNPTEDDPKITVWDAKGKIITPGLFDSGTSIGLLEVSGTKAKDHIYKGTGMTAGFKVSLAFNQYSSLIPIFRKEGVTHASIRPAPGLNPIAGLGSIVHLGDAPDPSVAGETAVYVYLGEKGRDLAGESRAAALQGLLTALEETKLYIDNPGAYKYGLLQELDLSPVDLKVLGSVLDGSRPLALFINRAADIRMVLNELDPYELKIILMGAREAWKVTDEISSRNIPVVLNVIDNIPSSFDQLGARLDQAALLKKAGIQFAFMTEDLFTESRVLTQAAGVAVAHGLPWLDALRAITLNPAKIWGVEDKTGSIAVGKQANLVVWSGDPLELNTSPERIMIHGKWIDMQTRQDLLRDRYKDIYDKEKPFGYR